ncbi:nuclease domain-containing protein [Paraburkholderia xenovorans]
MLTRKTPLRRKPWKSSPIESKDWRTELRSGGIKRKARKKRSQHDAKMLDACRGQHCYLRVPGLCRRLDPEETIVPAHSNESAHGKGGARKADDRYTVPACGLCHYWLDFGGAPQLLKCSTWRRAYREWSTVRDGVPDESVGELDG